MNSIVSLRLRFSVTIISSICCCACLETNGQLSVLLKPSARTVSVSDMNLATEDMASDYLTVIACGCLIRENLNAVGHDETWLANELKKAKLTSHKDVFLLIVDDLDHVILIPKKKDTKPSQKDV